ncbi:MAG: metal-dependent hydrolase [Myxococcota bacterium]|nr:metal-dependent hydrolase [Myxococcota bacterium]
MTIPRRDVELGLEPSTVPRDWCHDDAFQTTFMNALSLLFPEGERFFVDSVKAHREGITDPTLRAQITGFIGQEAMHGKEHRAFNELLVAHGYTAVPRIEAGLRRFLGRVRQTLSPRSQLAATCALEHFTAILAEGLLSDERMRRELHPTVRPLWLWHAFEESEHKAVAFDVYRAAGGGEVRRLAIMLLTTAVFFGAHATVHARLMTARGIALEPWTWLTGVRRLWIAPGYFARLLPAYLAYYRPGFHPDDRDTRALLATWEELLFGPAGALRQHVRDVA